MKKKQKAFTIVELVVVIAIMVIMFGVFAVNFRQGEQANKLQRSAQRVIQGLRKAQNMALSSVEHQGAIYDYYGVHFDAQNMPDSYHIFASENQTYSPPEETMEIINLEKGIVINSVVPNQGNKLNILFSPPYAFVALLPPSADEAIIVIKTEGGTCPDNCKYIKINDEGWMSIKDSP